MCIENKDLLKLLSNENVVFFTGAGLSDTAGVPKWNELLEGMAAPFKSKLSWMNFRKFDLIDSFLYPEIAQLIFAIYESNNNEEGYYNIIEDNIKPKKATSSQIITQLFELGGRVITTNFDSIHEGSFEKIKVRNDVDDLKIDIINNSSELKEIYSENHLIYFHGSIKDVKNIVFKTTDYDKHYNLNGDYKSTNVWKFLKKVYSEETIVFIGISFRDRYLEKLLKRIFHSINEDRSKKLTKENYRPLKHYALMEKGNDEILRKSLHDIGIEIVEYKKEYHSEIEVFLESACKSRIKKKPGEKFDPNC